MRLRVASIVVLLSEAFVGTALAQTYTPKTIRIDAPPGVDTAAVLRLAALPQASPLTKAQIEAAMQRLGDSGMYSDVNWAVDAKALVITLTPSAEDQLLPVRFSNFVWWPPTEMEGLVENRVPAFHGKLPLAGTLTHQVEDALVDLLKEKGVEAKVTAVQAGSLGGSIAAVTLAISQPKIVIGEIDLGTTLPVLAGPLQKVKDRLRGEEFDQSESTKAVRASVNDLYSNEGYLDVSTGVPAYSAPKKDLDRYVVDLTTAVTAGAVYRVAKVDIEPAAPLSAAELLKVATLKAGDAASPAALRLADGEMQKAYGDRGYLAAVVDVRTTKDASAHTVEYGFTAHPGEVYHLDGVDTTALSPAQQQTFANSFHAAPGAVADAALRNAIVKGLMALRLDKMPSIQTNADRTLRTVVYKIRPAK